MTVKFTDLPSLAAVDIADDDVLAVSDISAAASKKVTVADLLSSLSIAELTQLEVENPASTVFGQVSGERLSQAIAANVPLTQEYTSSEQTITTAGSVTLAHGLGVAPRLLQYRLICKTTQAGYLVNDIIDPMLSYNASFSSGAVPYGAAVVVDATSVRVQYGDSVQVFAVLHKTLGNIQGLTNANWRLVVRAWA